MNQIFSTQLFCFLPTEFSLWNTIWLLLNHNFLFVISCLIKYHFSKAKFCSIQPVPLMSVCFTVLDSYAYYWCLKHRFENGTSPITFPCPSCPWGKVHDVYTAKRLEFHCHVLPCMNSMPQRHCSICFSLKTMLIFCWMHFLI